MSQPSKPIPSPRAVPQPAPAQKARVASVPPVDSKACTGLSFPFPFPPEYDAPMQPPAKP